MQMGLKTFLILLLFSALTSVAFAVPTTSSCIPVTLTIEGKNIILPGTSDPKMPVVYFFQNKSLQSVWVDHPDMKRRGMGAGWASYIRPGNWSAIVLNKKNFTVSCSMIQPGKVEILDCSNTLSVCSPPNITSSTPLSGNVWLVEDKKWENFSHLLEKKGFRY